MTFRNHLVRWEDEFKPMGLVIVELSGGEHIEFELSKQRLQKWNPRHRVLWDQNNNNAKAYAISGWPSTYLIGPDGNVFWQGNPAFLRGRKEEEDVFRKELTRQLESARYLVLKAVSPYASAASGR